MAYAVMGWLIVATLLTLVFLPALYVAWFRARVHPAEVASPETAQTRYLTQINAYMAVAARMRELLSFSRAMMFSSKEKSS